MNVLTSLALRFPRATIAIGAAVALVAAPGVLRLTLRTDGHALVPDGAAEVQYDLQVRDKFDLKDPLVIFIEAQHPNGVFNEHTLQLVDQISSDLNKLDGVRPHDVFSLATEKSDRVWPGTLKFRGFLAPMPQTEEELNRLRDDLRALKVYSGTLVSKDEKSTALLVGAPRGADRLRFMEQVRSLVRRYDHRPDGPVPNAEGDGAERIHVLGAPVAEALLGTHILEDLGVPKSLLGASAYSERAQLHPPHNLEELRIWIARTIGLAPLAVLLMALVFLASFRSFTAAALPLLEVGACLLFVFGLMGWLGVPIYLTTAVLPVILTATAVTDEVHVFSRFFHVLHADPEHDNVAAVRTTMDELGRAIIMTSVTTGIGFLSFVFSSIEPVRSFGVFASVGMLFSMLWTLSFVPASLALISPRRFLRPSIGERGTAFLWRLFRRVGLFVIRLRFLVLAATAVAIIIAPLGIRRVFVQDSWIDGFSPSSEFYKSTALFDEQFLGMHVLHVVVDAGGRSFAGDAAATDLGDREVRLPAVSIDTDSSLNGWRLRLVRVGGATEPPAGGFKPVEKYEWWVESATKEEDRFVLTLQAGRPAPTRILGLAAESRVRFELSPAPFMQPDVLRRVGELEKFIERRDEDAVGGVLGPAEYVATTNFMILGRRAGERRIPADVLHVERTWQEYGRVRGEERLRQLVDAAYNQAVLTILIRDANFVGTARLMDAIRNYEKENLSPYGISLSFAGDVAVSQTLIGAIVGTQLQSVLGSLLGILAVTVVLGRSLWFGILCVIPCGIAVLMNFAAMGWLSIPLGVATSMFASMALGIGVDYAVHLQSHWRRLQTEGRARREALIESVATTGPAILIDTLAVVVGFGVLTLSQVPANARLGGLVVVSIGTCFVATVLVLPALLALAVGRDSESQSRPGAPDVD